MCDVQSTNAEQNSISSVTCGQEKTKMDSCASIGSEASSIGFTNANTTLADTSCTGLGTIGLGSSKMISEVQTTSFSLTETMKREEENLQQKTDRAEMKLEPERMKAFNEWSDEELKEHRYKRLQHLLTKSNAYTGYLVERMKAQQEAERKREERHAQKLAREKEKAEKLEQERLQAEKNKSLASADNDTNLHSTTADDISESHRPSSPTVASCPPSSPKPPQSAHTSPSRTPKSDSILSQTNANYTVRASRRQTRSSKAHQNSQESPVESEASQQSSQDSQRSPPVSKKQTRKRKAQTAKDIDNYKISDYLTEAISRNKRLKAADKENEQQEDDNRATKSAATENDRVPPTSSIPEITQTVVLDSNQSQSSGKACETIVGGDGKTTANGEVESNSPSELFSGGVLRSYQEDGVRWLKVLYENGVNGILADEMGLGKTVQCIAVISYLIKQGIPGPFLVIAPLSTVPNWMSEFKRFAPKVPTMLYHGSKDERYLMRMSMVKRYMIDGILEAYPVVITSYVIVMNDKNYINSHPWKYIIVDEGHRMKNHNCRLVKELKTYNSTHRLLLTGTPLQNNLSELWSLLNFLLPEIFDDLSSFQAWFDVDYLESNNTHDEIVLEEQRKNILSMLHQILTPFMLRRLKTDVDLVIPPKREYLVYAPLTVKQKSVYESIIDKTIRYLIEEKPPELQEEPELNENGRPKRQSKTNLKYDLMMDPVTTGQKSSDDDDIDKWAQAIVDIQEEKEAERTKSKKPATAIINVQLRNTMMLMKRCCNHPYLIEYPLTKDGELKIDEDIVRASGKFLLLDHMLRELKKRGHKVLIFSQMTSMLDILQDFCYYRKYNYCRLDGTMSLPEREQQMANFNNDDVFIFLLSTRAGGLGINLTAADTVIIFDSDWNPQSDLQAQDRCHRIGQDRPVVVYRLVTINTVDQKIVERASAKRKLEKMVILKGKFKSGFDNFTLDLKYIDKNELLALLKSRDYDAVFTGRGDVISKRDLDRLIDRSDLYEAWMEQQERHSNGNVSKKERVCEDVEGVFKVVRQSS